MAGSSNGRLLQYDIISGKIYQTTWSMCIVASREAFEKSGGYPEDVVMAEDHDFIINCWPFGNYGILPLPVIFSVRRLDKEGRFGLATKYVKGPVYRVFKGPIRKPIFEYEFKYSDEENKAK